METAILNGRVVTPEGITQTDIYIKNGIIESLGCGGAARESYDAAGCLVFPGFIDAHTHFQMEAAGTVTADSFLTGTAAALCGGTTTIIDFATQEKGHSLSDALEVWAGRAGGCCSTDYAFHMAVTDWNAETAGEMAKMISAGVTSFKAYMAYDNLRLSDNEIFEMLVRSGELGALVGVHCELGDKVNQGVRQLRDAGLVAPSYHPVSRPPEVEALAVRRFMELSRRAGVPAWVVHLSTEAGLLELKSAGARELGMLVETCPQYLTLTEDRYKGLEGAKYVCSPPLRGIADKNALWEGVLNGDIDIISTDHCSFNYNGQKNQADFSKIPNGLPGVEHRPALMWFYGNKMGITPEKLVALMSENPARAFGMYPRKGAILPGSDADIVVWEPDEEWTLTAECQVQNVDYTPWEGKLVRGRAKAVFLRGERCAENGRVISARRGRFVKRKPPRLCQTPISDIS